MRKMKIHSLHTEHTSSRKTDTTEKPPAIEKIRTGGIRPERRKLPPTVRWIMTPKIASRSQSKPKYSKS
jgi:hypothetical protein